MAEGFLKSFDSKLEVFSAGTNPAARVSSRAIQLMKEMAIDIAAAIRNRLTNLQLNRSIMFITVCDHAKETCPIFIGNVKHRVHIGFDDPAEATGTEEEVLAVFRRVRDEIKEKFFGFYQSKLKESQG